MLAHFLDGLVLHRRGRNEALPPRPVEKRISNNLVLMKMKHPGVASQQVESIGRAVGSARSSSSGATRR